MPHAGGLHAAAAGNTSVTTVHEAHFDPRLDANRRWSPQKPHAQARRNRHHQNRPEGILRGARPRPWVVRRRCVGNNRRVRDGGRRRQPAPRTRGAMRPPTVTRCRRRTMQRPLTGATATPTCRVTSRTAAPAGTPARSGRSATQASVSSAPRRSFSVRAPAAST